MILKVLGFIIGRRTYKMSIKGTSGNNFENVKGAKEALNTSEVAKTSTSNIAKLQSIVGSVLDKMSTTGNTMRVLPELSSIK